VRRKFLVLLISLLLCLVGAIYWLRPDHRSLLRVVTPKSVIYAEVADTQVEREKGLSGRESLAKNEGMLFVFEKDQAKCFWMKNTFIPLDMIWLDAEKKVVFIHENATPESELAICPDKAATYVLEVNGGKVDQLGIDLDSRLSF
jgi:uncharacterized membrane protein (UPF0127 family)